MRVTVHGKNCRVCLNVNTQAARLVHIALRIFRAGQFFAKSMKPKTIVDALAQDTAGIVLALKDEQNGGRLRRRV